MKTTSLIQKLTPFSLLYWEGINKIQWIIVQIVNVSFICIIYYLYFNEFNVKEFIYSMNMLDIIFYGFLILGFLTILFNTEKLGKAIVTLIILLGFFLITQGSVEIDLKDIWFFMLITLTYIWVVEISKTDSLDVRCLKLLIWCGASLMVLSSHLILIYIGIELQTFSIFILITKQRSSLRSAEAGLKYFFLAALSSGLYLIGMISLFHLYHTMDITVLSTFYGLDSFFYGASALLTLSIIFKLALWPLHYYLPDIYEGSSTDVITLIATLPKISMICFLLKFYCPHQFFLYIGIGSIIVGSLGGFNQTKLKRLLAYSSITHLGFMAIAWNLFSSLGIEILLIYLFLYVFTSLGLFFLLMKQANQEDIFIVELTQWSISSKMKSFLWALFFLSLAGLPPLIGFIGKWWIIVQLINTYYWKTTFCLLFFSCISIGFYLRLSKIIYFQPYSSYLTWHSVLKPQKKDTSTFLSYILTCVLVFFSLFGVLIPNVWTSLIYLIYL